MTRQYPIMESLGASVDDMLEHIDQVYVDSLTVLMFSDQLVTASMLCQFVTYREV